MNNEKRLGKTGVWTALLETCDDAGKPIVLAAPEWSSASWPFDKAYWEKLPIIGREVES